MLNPHISVAIRLMAFADQVAAYQNTHLTLACNHRTSERPGRVFCALSCQAKYIVADKKQLALFLRQTVTDFLRTTAHSVKCVLAIVEACVCVCVLCVHVCLSVTHCECIKAVQARSQILHRGCHNRKAQLTQRYCFQEFIKLGDSLTLLSDT